MSVGHRYRYSLGFAVLACSLLSSERGYSLPSGGTVVNGTVTFSNPNPNELNINQGTDRAIINWHNFSINSNEWVRFLQPSSSSATLNRVTSSIPSSIAGRLTANGFVFLVNPNGIAFLPGAVVNVNGLVASTLDISNADFLKGGTLNSSGIPESFIFQRGASIEAKGITVASGAEITIGKGGVGAFISPAIQNNGVVVAKVGRVGLFSGDQVELNVGELVVNPFGDGYLSFTVSPTTAQDIRDIYGNPISSYIDHQGRITAPGGVIALSANSAQQIVQNVINTGGILEANTFQGIPGGIMLVASGETKVQAGGNFSADQVQITGKENIVSGQIKANESIYIGETYPSFLGNQVVANNYSDNERTIIMPSATLKATEEIVLGSKQETYFGGVAETPLMRIVNDGLPTLGANWNKFENQVDELIVRRFGTSDLSIFPEDIVIQGGRDPYNASANTVTSSFINKGVVFADDISQFLENDNALTISNREGDGRGFIYVRGDTDINWSKGTQLAIEAEEGLSIEWGTRISNTFSDHGFTALRLSGNLIGTARPDYDFNGVEIGVNNNLGSKIITGNFTSFYGNDIKIKTDAGDVYIEGLANNKWGVLAYKTSIATGSGGIFIYGSGNDGVQLALGEIKTESGNIYLDGYSGSELLGSAIGLRLSSNPISVSDVGNVSLIGVTRSLGVAESVLVEGSSIDINRGNLKIYGDAAAGHSVLLTSSDINVNEGDIGIWGYIQKDNGNLPNLRPVSISESSINQGSGNLRIVGRVLEIDKSQADYYGTIWNYYGQGSGVSLFRSHINQGAGTIEIDGQGLTGFSHYNASINQGSGGIGIVATGYGGWGAFVLNPAEGSSTFNVTGDNSDIAINAINRGGNIGINEIVGLIVNTRNGNIWINSNKDVLSDTFSVKNETGNISVQVAGNFEGGRVELSSDAGNILLASKRLTVNSDKYSSWFSSDFIRANSEDSLVSIFTDEFNIVPTPMGDYAQIQGRGSLWIGGYSGTDMFVNLPDTSSGLSINEGEFNAIGRDFQELIFGGSSGTNNIQVGLIERDQNVQLWNNNDTIWLIDRINIGDKRLTVNTNGEAKQESHANIQANSLALIGEGDIQFSTASNTINEVYGWARRLNFRNSQGLIASGLFINDTLDIETETGTLELAGYVNVGGDYARLRGQGGIIQTESGGLSVKNLSLLSDGNVDLQRSWNTVDELNGLVRGGLIFKNTGNTKINNLTTEDGDIILAGNNYQLLGLLQSGKNIVFDVAGGVEQEAGSRINASGLGVRSDWARLGGNNTIQTIAAETNGSFSISSSDSLTIGEVRAIVDGVPAQLVEDTPDERVVSGITTSNKDVSVYSGNQIFIDKAVNAGTGNVILGSESGILQAEAGNITGDGLAVYGGGPVDLSHATNNIKTLAVHLQDEGFVIANNGDLRIGEVGTISGIQVPNGDVIIASEGDINVEADIQVNNVVFASGGSIEQAQNTNAEGNGLGVIANGFVDMFGRFIVFAAQAGGDVRYENQSNDLRIDRVTATVSAVTPDDDIDERTVTQTIANKARITTKGTLITAEDITVAETLSLGGEKGILQSDGIISVPGIEIKSNGPVDLGNPFNLIDVVAADINGNNHDEGLVFRSVRDLRIGTVNDTQGINTNNADVIIAASGRIYLEDKVNVGTGDLFLSSLSGISQGNNGILSGDGVALQAQEDIDLRNSNNQFNRLAVATEGGITISERDGYAIDTITARVREVTADDMPDEATLSIVQVGQDFITRTPRLTLNKDLISFGNTTLITDRVDGNGQLRVDGLGLQGGGSSASDYQINGSFSTFAWETHIEPTQAHSDVPFTVGRVTSTVNTDRVTTETRLFDPPPPVDPPPIEPPPIEIPVGGPIDLPPPPVEPPPIEIPVSGPIDLPPPVEPATEPFVAVAPEPSASMPAVARDCVYDVNSAKPVELNEACELPQVKADNKDNVSVFNFIIRLLQGLR